MVVVVLQQDHAQSYKTDIIWSLYAYPQETSTRGVEIVKFSTCPGTSKWP